jgi:hypothetical protein
MKKLALVPLKTRIVAIEATYGAAARRIIVALSSLEPDTYTAVKSGMVLSRVKDIIGELDTAVQMWAPGAIRAAYEESSGIARTRLEMIGAKRLPERRYNPVRHDKKIAALTKTVMTDYWKANRTIEKTAQKYLAIVGQAATGIKKIEQVQMFDPAEVKGFINRMVSASLRARTKYNVGMAHLTSKDIAAKIRAKLLDQIGGGNFITINGRDYNLRSYAELVARTRMRESQSEATKDLCEEFDNDLVQFSKHDSPCEVCAPLEGQVFSISGNDPDYPELTDDVTPPIHPRCGHDIGPTSRNALAWRNK